MIAEPGATWQSAVELGARGEYAEAERLAIDLEAVGGRWTSLALSTRASHLRQVGASSAALDVRALEFATDDESAADALIGLAADSVAVGDVNAAVARHVEAGAVAREWRGRTRWHWVGAEIALLAGDQSRAQEHGRRAVLTSAGRSDRHHAKSLIVACAASGDLAGMEGVLDLSVDRGWHTLVWPLALVVADRVHDRPWADRAWADRAWECGARATRVIEAGLPPRLVEMWQDHPGVRRLRGGGSPKGSE
ncbi:MAG: hypothetical protein ACO3J3_07920 [Candidatus Nanopelagicales bacterium]